MRAIPDQVVEATFQAGMSGLEGVVAYRIDTPPSGPLVVERTTDGVVERPTGSGIYSASFTAPAEAGQYLIVWDTGGENAQFASEDLVVDPIPESALGAGIIPTVEEIASYLHARTVSLTTGEELGTFTTDDTRPTEGQVGLLIADAVATVAGRAGTATIGALAAPIARSAIALRTALLVELGYFPESTTADDSTYANLRALYDEAIAGMIAALENNLPNRPRFGSVAMGTDVDPWGAFACVNDTLREDLEP